MGMWNNLQSQVVIKKSSGGLGEEDNWLLACSEPPINITFSLHPVSSRGKHFALAPFLNSEFTIFC